MLYQLELDEQKAIPFAFKDMEAVKKAGYEQPPAAQYRMVWTGEVYCPTGQSDTEILQRLFSELSVELPEGCNGRPMSLSDVVELEYPMKRIYYYVNGDTQFQQVKFSPMLAKKRFREEHEQIDGCCKRNEEGTVGSTFGAMRSAECGCSPQHKTGIFHGDSSAALEYFGTAGGAGSTGTNQRMGGAVPKCGLLLL